MMATVLFALALLGCAITPAPSASLSAVDHAICQLVPIARQVPVDLRAAVAAAQRGDQATMTNAAQRAADRGKQVYRAIGGLGQELSSRPVLADLYSVGEIGEQGGIFFTGASRIPDAQELASLQAWLPVLDQTLARIHADLATDHLSDCWPA